MNIKLKLPRRLSGRRGSCQPDCPRRPSFLAARFLTPIAPACLSLVAQRRARANTLSSRSNSRRQITDPVHALLCQPPRPAPFRRRRGPLRSLPRGWSFQRRLRTNHRLNARARPASSKSASAVRPRFIECGFKRSALPLPRLRPSNAPSRAVHLCHLLGDGFESRDA